MDPKTHRRGWPGDEPTERKELSCDGIRPLYKAFETLDEEGQKALEEDLISVVEHYNRSRDGTAVWPGDYLEVVATRG